MINLIGLAAGFGLSFLSLGILWTGVNQWIQTVVTIGFFGVSYFIAGKSKNAVSTLLLGAVPVGGMLLLFRDKNDSHLLSIMIVSSWFVAALAASRFKK